MVEESIADTYGEGCVPKKRKQSEGPDSENSDSESSTEVVERKEGDKANRRHLWDVMQQEDKENTSEAPATVITPRRNKFAVSPQSLKKERFDINAVVDKPTVKTEVKSRFFQAQSKLAFKRTPTYTSREEGISNKGDNPAVKSEPIEEDQHAASEEAEGVACSEMSRASQQSADDLEENLKESTASIKSSSASQGKNSPSAFSWSKFKFSKQAGKGLGSHIDSETTKTNSKVSQPFKQLKVARKECADKNDEPDEKGESLDSEEKVQPVSYSNDDESGYYSSSMDIGDSSASQNTNLSQPSQSVTQGKQGISATELDTIDLTDVEEDTTNTLQHQRFASQTDLPAGCSTVTKEVGNVKFIRSEFCFIVASCS